MITVTEYDGDIKDKAKTAPPLHRSRTDSIISYCNPGDNLIQLRKPSNNLSRPVRGCRLNILYHKRWKYRFVSCTEGIDQFYLVLPLIICFFTKGLHNISLNEKACTARVCEVLLYLISTILDLGLLVVISKKEDQAAVEKHAKIEYLDILSNHNMAMDIVVR